MPLTPAEVVAQLQNFVNIIASGNATPALTAQWQSFFSANIDALVSPALSGTIISVPATNIAPAGTMSWGNAVHNVNNAYNGVAIVASTGQPPTFGSANVGMPTTAAQAGQYNFYNNTLGGQQLTGLNGQIVPPVTTPAQQAAINAANQAILNNLNAQVPVRPPRPPRPGGFTAGVFEPGVLQALSQQAGQVYDVTTGTWVPDPNFVPVYSPLTYPGLALTAAQIPNALQVLNLLGLGASNFPQSTPGAMPPRPGSILGMGGVGYGILGIGAAPPLTYSSTGGTWGPPSGNGLTGNPGGI